MDVDLLLTPVWTPDGRKRSEGQVLITNVCVWECVCFGRNTLLLSIRDY